jgi:release factor glutamine methyltransferase
MLAGHLRRELHGPGKTVLDLCTGSGVLAVSAALAGASQVTAVDVSRRAIAAVRLNSALNGVRVDALRGDLFTPLGGRGFDLIVSNPPYLPSPDEGLPAAGLARAWEAGSSGRAFIDRICVEAARHLHEGGVLLLVQSSVCGEQATLELLRGHGLSAAVADRRRGPLGPLLRERAPWLRRQGLLLDGDDEEILVVRAQRPDDRTPHSAETPGAQLGCGTIRM